MRIWLILILMDFSWMPILLVLPTWTVWIGFSWLLIWMFRFQLVADFNVCRIIVSDVALLKLDKPVQVFNFKSKFPISCFLFLIWKTHCKVFNLNVIVASTKRFPKQFSFFFWTAFIAKLVKPIQVFSFWRVSDPTGLGRGQLVQVLTNVFFGASNN